MGEGLSRPDKLTQIFTLGVILVVMNEFMSQTEYREFKAILYDLRVRLGDHFEITQDQRVHKLP